MRVHVVSDVHGNVEALARAGENADALVVLGDLLDFIDYREYGNGIFGSLFGADSVRTFARLRREAGREDLIAFSRSLWASLDNPSESVDEAVREQYSRLFGALTAPTYATPGNVDTPALWPEFAGPNVHILDGEVAVIGGLRFGFVGGALLPEDAIQRTSGPWHPHLRPTDDFDTAVQALSAVDVLCSHIPPAVPELTYDVLARRAELGSDSLLALIARERPRCSLFGHVHQPLATRVRRGKTECRNVGHFKETERPYVLHL